MQLAVEVDFYVFTSIARLRLPDHAYTVSLFITLPIKLNL